MLLSGKFVVFPLIYEHDCRFSGHCLRRKVEVINQLLLWDPMHGKRSRGRSVRTYIDQLMDDAQLDNEELPFAMDDRDGWKRQVMDARLRSIGR